MADLVDALIQERLFGFGEMPPPGSNGGERWLSVRCGAGCVVRVRVRGAAALQPYRFARGPVLCGSRELAPDELLSLLAGDGAPFAAQVCVDLRAAVEHARATLAAHRDLVPRAGELLAGERLAATRGRPFHPTARAAAGWTADELSRYGPMRREPLGLDWLAVRADRVCLGAGAGGDRLAPLLLDARDAAALGARADALDGERCLLPVHPWQAEHVLPAAFGAELRSGCMRFVARGVGRFAPTASLRTLASPDPAVHVKLPLSIATLGATRLLPPRYLRNGERGEELMRALVQRDPVLRRRVSLCDERTWCGWNEDEFAPRAGQLAAQLRRYPRDVLEQPGTVMIAMAALAAHEWETLGPAILAGLDPVRFFAKLARAFAETALSFLRYGVLPELHGQNVVVVLRDGIAERFVLRDHDTLRLYEPWMRAAGVADPGYRIRPGAAQSLVLDRGEDLVGYLQTLGLQVNLFAIADALGRHHGIGEAVFWEQQRVAVTGCLRDLDLPARTARVVREQLLCAQTWPSRQILGPLLAQGSSAGVSMPAATGSVPNPLLRDAPPMSRALQAARRASRERLLNAFLRETGMHDVQHGKLRVPLPASGRALIVDVRHRSPLGHHEYGDDVILEQPDGGRAAVEQDAFVDALLNELTCTSEGNGDGRSRAAEIAARIADSTARTARYLREGGWSAPPGDATAAIREAEQSLLVGHPFHPSPKSAEGFDDADLARYAPELGASFRLHWFAVDERLVCERRVTAGAWMTPEVAADAMAGFALLPAHPWQARYLLAQPAFAELVAAGAVRPLGQRGPQVYATSSVRTVCAPGFETAWKLALHVRITNFVRTNPVEHVRRATDASALVTALSPHWPDDGFNVLVETGFRGLDPAVAGAALAADTAVLFRRHPFGRTGPAPRVLAGLLEAGSDGKLPQIVRCARLAGDVSEWLRRYLEISLRPLLARFARDGLSFEAHVQNSLLCMDDGGWPTSFWVRDMEGMAASRQRLAANGTATALPADSPVLYDDDEAWLRLRYYAVTNQLGHLIAVLGRHGEAGEERLWGVARDALRSWPEPLAAWLLAAPHLPAKANLLGCVAGSADRPSYVNIPNPLHRR